MTLSFIESIDGSVQPPNAIDRADVIAIPVFRDFQRRGLIPSEFGTGEAARSPLRCPFFFPTTTTGFSSLKKNVFQQHRWQTLSRLHELFSLAASTLDAALERTFPLPIHPHPTHIRSRSTSHELQQ